ncbi:MAG TPA: hypothetical protein VGH96_03965 [Streptosporangiaceae bacterium]
MAGRVVRVRAGRPASCLLAAGLSTLSGSLHGGAARTVHARPLAVEPCTTSFGHPVHRHDDPRAPLLEVVYAFTTGEDRVRLENARRQAGPPNSDLALCALTYAAGRSPRRRWRSSPSPALRVWIAHAAGEYAEPPLRFRGRAVIGCSRRPSRGS